MSNKGYTQGAFGQYAPSKEEIGIFKVLDKLLRACPSCMDSDEDLQKAVIQSLSVQPKPQIFPTHGPIIEEVMDCAKKFMIPELKEELMKEQNVPTISKNPIKVSKSDYEMMEKVYKDASINYAYGKTPSAYSWGFSGFTPASPTAPDAYITNQAADGNITFTEVKSTGTAKPMLSKQLFGITNTSTPPPSQPKAPPKTFTMDELYAAEIADKANGVVKYAAEPKPKKPKMEKLLEDIAEAKFQEKKSTGQQVIETLGAAFAKDAQKFMESDAYNAESPLLKYLKELK